MTRVELQGVEMAPLDGPAGGVAGLRILFVNLFAVQGARGWTLIDAGLPGSRRKIVRWVEARFGSGARPASIVLTHGHFDHVGAVEEMAKRWDVPVYAHPLEAPYLSGREKYPPAAPEVGGGLMALSSPLYPRGPIDLGSRLQNLPDDGSVPDLPDWRWLHTPGHSRGHISLFRDADRALIVGDAFCTTKQESLSAVASQRMELHGPPAYFTPDWDAAKGSVEKLAALRPATICPGHGRALRGAQDALEMLAAHFDRIARPQRGRYVGRGPTNGGNRRE